MRFTQHLKTREDIKPNINKCIIIILFIYYYYQLTARIFHLQYYSYMFRLQAIAILRDLLCSKTYTSVIMWLVDRKLLTYVNCHSTIKS
jgi:hypothetical protein